MKKNHDLIFRRMQKFSLQFSGSCKDKSYCEGNYGEFYSNKKLNQKTNFKFIEQKSEIELR